MFAGMRGKVKKVRPERSANSVALEMIARRRLTEREIFVKLEAAGYSPDDIASSIDRLRELGYVNDELLAVEAASALASIKLLGPARISAKLKMRGIPEMCIEKAVAGVFSEIDVRDIAMRSIKKRYNRRSSSLKDKGEVLRIYRFLQREGFNHSTIKSVMEGYDIETDEH